MHARVGVERRLGGRTELRNLQDDRLRRGSGRIRRRRRDALRFELPRNARIDNVVETAFLDELVDGARNGNHFFAFQTLIELLRDLDHMLVEIDPILIGFVVLQPRLGLFFGAHALDVRLYGPFVGEHLELTDKALCVEKGAKDLAVEK